MLRLILRLYWKLIGWKVTGEFPHHLKKMVIIVAPHTSWIDLPVGLAARDQYKIQNGHFLGKKELFKGPLGWFLRSQGGTPVDRFSPHGVVGQAIELFEKNEAFVLVLAPEGTRKKVDKLRSGFYHIARRANVPILMAALDYEHKEVRLGEPFYATDDEEGDMKKIIGFFSRFRGKKPENDLRHLNNG